MRCYTMGEAQNSRCDITARLRGKTLPLSRALNSTLQDPSWHQARNVTTRSITKHNIHRFSSLANDDHEHMKHLISHLRLSSTWGNLS
jgi:hypothetical protein